MEFTVLSNRIERLRKKVQRIANKGVPVTFEILRRHDVKSEKYEGVYHEAYDVEVEGFYRIDGWEFVGTVEHRDNGNVIRLANSSFEGKLPERFRHCEPHCEHCNSHRRRKDTYIVHNVETDEYKMVGKQCLMSYTNGLDATVCAEMVSLYEEPETEDDELCFESFVSHNSFFGVDNAKTKAVAYAIVSENGYVGGGTTTYKMANVLLGRMHSDEYDNLYDNEIAKIDVWVENLDAKGEYLMNAKTMWQSEEPYFYRDFALVASLIGVYLREKSKEVVRQSHKDMVSGSEWIGEIGERIEFVAKNVRALYVKSNSHMSYYACDSTVYEIVTEDGDVVVWSTSSEVEVGMRIVATVVSHDEYKGVKQTKVSRGKIVA